MGRSVVFAFACALVVNAGVLLALPLLGGALETATGAPVVLELHEVDVVKLPEPPAARLPREVFVKENEKVRSQPEQPPPPAEPISSKMRPDSGIPDEMLSEIDIEINAGPLTPGLDLTIPRGNGFGSPVAAGSGAGELQNEAVSLDEVDRLPVKVHHVQPLYPQWALEAGAEAEVTLSLVIGADGAVGRLAVERSSGYEDFDRAALQAVKMWRFAPALLRGRAIAVRAIQKIKFGFR